MISRIITPSHGMVFGFRWSLVGLCIALFYIASCDLFIPPDNNKPRFNTVYGEKRRPVMNPGGQGYRGMNTMDERQRSIDAVYGAGAPTQASPTLTTPAGPLTTPAPAPAPAPAPQSMREEPSKEESFWDRLAFWRDDEPPIAETPASERRAPAENLALNETSANAPATAIAASDLAPPTGAAPMQVAASDYPKLYTTPENPGPAANDNTRQRLDATRAELEAERSTATSDRDRLARDAVAEPSLLESLPAMRDSGQLPPLPPPPAGANMRVPAPAPVPAPKPAPVAQVAPAPTPVATTSTSSFERLTSHPLERSKPAENPAPVAKAPAPIAPLPAPAPKLASVAPPDASIPLTPPPAAPRSIEIAPPPAVASVAPPAPARPALEPIRLTPPPGVLAEGMAATPVAPQLPTGEPMQLTEPAPYTTDAGFLPSSRYSQRRRM